MNRFTNLPLPASTFARVSLRRLRSAAAGLCVFIAACGGGADAPPPAETAPLAAPPAVTHQPADVSVTAGQPATFTVAATGTPSLAFQWQRNGADITGATTASYSLPTTVPTDSGAVFRAVVSNAAGAATSNPATLTVTLAQPVLTITQQPADASVTAGSPASFVVAATCSSGSLNIQWQHNTGAAGAFVAIASAAGPSYAFTSAIADNGAQFRAALDCGGQSAATSAAATLTVTSPAAGVLAPVAITGLRSQAVITASHAIVREPAGSYAFVSGTRVLRLAADLKSITLIAGSPDNPTSATTDGVGAAAQFGNPYGLTVDAAGNLFVTERDGHVIRRIATDGTVTTLAGKPGVSGSAEGTGSAARFNFLQAIAIGPDGDLYVVDGANHVIRRVTMAGVVTTYAGIPGGFGYVDGPAAAAKFNSPTGIAVAEDGTVYVSNAEGRIRRIRRSGNAAGAVDTFAGGLNTASADGTGTAATFSAPQQMAISGTTLYVRDSAGLVRKIDTGTAVVTTFAGTTAPFAGFDGPRGVATLDKANFGGGLAPTPDGGLVITEAHDLFGAVRRIDATGVVTTIAIAQPPAAGNSPLGTGVLAQLPFASIADNAPGTAPAQFNDPVAVAAAPDGSLVVGTRYNVRRIAPDGVVSPVIGLIGSGSFNGTGSAADVVDASAAVVVDPAGVIYFADVSSIRAIDPSRTARMIAGAASVPNDNSGQGQGGVDGPAATARFSRVTGLARAPNGDLFATDSLNFAIRRIDPAGNVSTYVGAMGQQGAADGARTSARFMQPSDLSHAPDGSLWLLDKVPAAGTYVVRHIAPDGTVSTLPARARRLTVDPAGTVYVLTEGLDLARMDVATGAMTVLVRNGAQLTLGSDPRIASDASWTFTAVGIKQLVLMSDRQLIKATLP